MPDDRPNILLILADQFRHDCLSCLDHPVVKTPHLDALAADGVLFRSAYCPSMACAPSRASIFTGRHLSGHHVGNNNHELDPPDLPVLPQLLWQSGYDTALVGKLHLKPFHRDFGFRHFLRHDAPYTNYFEPEAVESAYVDFLKKTQFREDPDRPVREFTADEACDGTDELRFILGTNIADEAHHETTWASQESIRFLDEEWDRSRPFFLNCSFYGPHQPYLCPGQWESMYDPSGIPLPPGFDLPVNDKPIFAGSGLAGRRNGREDWDEAVFRRVLSAYYGYVSMIDHHIGEITRHLQDSGLYDNTIILFTADHGDYGGQFRSFYKGNPYEGATHVPFVVHDPRSPKRGHTESAHVSNMDLFSSCLAWAGTRMQTGSDSRDFTDLLHGIGSGWDNVAHWSTRNQAMLVRNGVKVMREARKDGAVYEAYDLQADPLEAHNIAGTPAEADRVDSLRQELDAWCAEH